MSINKIAASSLHATERPHRMNIMSKNYGGKMEWVGLRGARVLMGREVGIRYAEADVSDAE